MTKRKPKTFEVGMLPVVGGQQWWSQALQTWVDYDPYAHTNGEKWAEHWKNSDGPVTNFQSGRKLFHSVFAETEIDGKVRRLPVFGYTSDVNSLKKYGYEVKRTDKGEPQVFIKVPAEYWLQTTLNLNGTKKAPLMCTYQAVKDYCESLLGVKLHSEDEDFFKTHPLVEEDGVPFAHTLRVVQELIDPYGLRISRVQIAPGLNLKGDILQWRRVLGCNPIALTDRQTSNSQFAAQGQDVSGFRFEYSSEVLHPAISCGIVGESSGANTGWSGGHATYIPPRRRAYGAMLSFQLDRAEHVHWKRPPVFEPIPETQAVLREVFDIDKWYKDHYDYKAPDKGEISKKNVTVKGTTGGGTTVFKFDPNACYNCNRHETYRKHAFKIPGLCDDCWVHTFCKAVMCDRKECQAKQKPYPPLIFTSFSLQAGIVNFQCPHCKDHLYVDKTWKKLKKLIENMINFEVDRLVYEETEARKEVSRLDNRMGTGVTSTDPADASLASTIPEAQPKKEDTTPTPESVNAEQQQQPTEPIIETYGFD